MNTTKQIKKYVGFYPASSNSEEWWTGNSIREIIRELKDGVVTETEPTIGRVRKIGEGRYMIEDIEIFNTEIHPNVTNYIE